MNQGERLTMAAAGSLLITSYIWFTWSEVSGFLSGKVGPIEGILGTSIGSFVTLYLCAAIGFEGKLHNDTSDKKQD